MSLDHLGKSMRTMSRPRFRCLLIIGFWVAVGCSTKTSGPRFDPALDGLGVSDVGPSVILPESTLIVSGQSFVGSPWGTPYLILKGKFHGNGEASDVDMEIPATYVSLQELRILVDESFLQMLGGKDGDFVGSIQVGVDSNVDLTRHTSPSISATLSFKDSLTPTIENVISDGPIFVNDWIDVDGSGFLLGGTEGETRAQVNGCFAKEGQADCLAIDPIEIPLHSTKQGSRGEARFAFLPQIAGIESGIFRGSLELQNHHGTGIVTTSAPIDLLYDVTPISVLAVGPNKASVGQHIEIVGGGFVPTDEETATLLELSGQFVPASPPNANPIAIDLVLVPQFVEGRLLRYTINEDDALGREFDLRYDNGQLSGQVTPVATYRGTRVAGKTVNFAFDIQSVKQVVYLDFTAQYLEALRSFGLRAMDAAIRKRVAEVIRRDYRTINLEVRTEYPEDFALFSVVEISGIDPNGRGLLGIDNTPGKDVGNMRLHDQIGGVNATTQKDGFAGYGGIFLESLFVFSTHPPNTEASGVGTELFDAIFDPVRPDTDGSPVRSADSPNTISLSGDLTCPSDVRTEQIACAARTLANLIGTTASHEIGHSLGLANPNASTFHYINNKANRLMDAGSNRSFAERAELNNEGPAHFCVQAYQYLRIILPTDEPDDLDNRPECN